jgi:hypothetical protein
VTGVPEQFGDEPIGTRAIALVNSQAPSEALDVLGRCSRADSCEAPAGTAVSGGLTLKLQQLNGELLNARLASPDGRLARMLKDHPSGESLVQEFYLTALSRRPTDEETAYLTRHFATADSGERFRATAEDFVWALLTCREFVTNH